jgi:hypothetical protein
LAFASRREHGAWSTDFSSRTLLLSRPKNRPFASAIACKERPPGELQDECFTMIAIACSPSTRLPIAVQSGHCVGVTA